MAIFAGKLFLFSFKKYLERFLMAFLVFTERKQYLCSADNTTAFVVNRYSIVTV